jgi:hypothetical protein
VKYPIKFGRAAGMTAARDESWAYAAAIARAFLPVKKSIGPLVAGTTLLKNLRPKMAAFPPSTRQPFQRHYLA